MAHARIGSRTASVGLLAALVLALALLTAPPASASARVDYLGLARAAAADTGFVSVGGQRSFAQIEECFEDDEGDEQPFGHEADDEDGVPQADILYHCVGFGPTLALTIGTAEVTDPFEDEGWQGATFLGWFIDTDGDEDAEYFARMNLDEQGRLVAVVSDLTGDEETQACVARPNVTSEYTISGISRSCIGDPDEIRIAVTAFYDTTPDAEREPGDTSGVWFDTAPGGGQYEDTPVEAGPEERETDRYSGAGRIQTAIAISQAEFTDPEDAESVYLARADLFADALSASTVTDGPILLVPRTGVLPAEVRAEIDRLDPDTVYAVGGTAAVSDNILAQAAGQRDAERISGSNRILTSVAVSQHVFADPDDATEAYLARADDFPDALAGGTLTDGPILLVNRTGQAPASVQAEIDRLDPDRVIALGGEGAVADSVLASAADERDSFRLGGSGRIETAIAIAQYAFPGSASEVYLARADDFPDALAGGVLTGGPILLVPRTLPTNPAVVEAFQRVQDEISRLSPERVIALGGTAAVAEEVLQQAASN
jgi:putative cell wall-binding protein